MADSVVVLEPGEERAQRIAKAMASQTAGEILRFIGEGPRTSTEIAEHLSLPMNTAQYHIGNLLDAGLISVGSTKYSVKGREIKVYTLTNQILIVAPKQLNLRSLLLKYASLFGIIAVGSIVIAAISSVMRSTGPAGDGFSQPSPAAAQVAGRAVTEAADGYLYNISGNGGEAMAAGGKGIQDLVASNATPTTETLAALARGSGDTAAASAQVFLDPALAFLLGGSIVIFLLLLYEIRIWRRMKRQ